MSCSSVPLCCQDELCLLELQGDHSAFELPGLCSIEEDVLVNKYITFSDETTDEGPRASSLPHAHLQGTVLDAAVKAKKSSDTRKKKRGTGMIRDGPGTPVVLHVYTTPLSRIAGYMGVPVVHVGVELFGLEFFFDCQEGVRCCQPAQYDSERHAETVPLGKTCLQRAAFQRLIIRMKHEFPAGSYRLLGFNCQTFSLALCKRLGLDTRCVPPNCFQFAQAAPLALGMCQATACS
mmetsp:Transcript_82555/g.242234  ORF Transcript_82555/g.242234 Transcript_82555/m.242234 type:complete len:235 (-) Transcript_82555:226-930(-)